MTLIFCGVWRGVLLLALAGFLAGCGGGGDDDSSKTVVPVNCRAAPEHCR